MGTDEEHDDGLGGRSRRRREVTESNRWGEALVALPRWHRVAIDMRDDLRAAVEEGARIESFIAKRRQVARIDAILRDLDEEQLAAVEAGMANPPPDPASQADSWVLRLRARGDEAIDAFVAENPSAERQRLRQLVRGGKPAALHRYLTELLDPEP
jgi:ribosome-associated protein